MIQKEKFLTGIDLINKDIGYFTENLILSVKRDQTHEIKGGYAYQETLTWIVQSKKMKREFVQKRRSDKSFNNFLKELSQKHADYFLKKYGQFWTGVIYANSSLNISKNFDDVASEVYDKCTHETVSEVA